MPTPAPVVREYSRLRRAGYSAADALRSAKIIAAFRKEEGERVRLRVEPEPESYFSFYGEPEGYTDQHGRYHSPEDERREISDRIDRLGLWHVVSEYRCSGCGAWEFADSVGMLEGHERPDDPAENWYIPDLMRSALDAIEAHPCAY